MKVLQIVPSISLIYGGPSQMAIGLSKSLAEAGLDVTIATTNSNGDFGQAPLDVPLGEAIARDGYQIIHFPCAPFRRYKFSVDLLRWLADNAANYDLAHVHCLFSPVTTAAATVCRYRKLPYLLRPLGTLDPADLQKKKALKQIYGRLFEGPNLAGAAAVHFTTAQEADISYRFGAKTRDIVIPLGVELGDRLPEPGAARKSLGIADDKPLILFLSRIDPKKGLNLLIDALKIVQKEGFDFHFVLAGSNPQDPDYEARIQQQIQALPLADRATIAGFVRGEQKLSLLQDADVFVLPSYYENFGIAVAEALAVGTPAIVSDKVYIWPEIATANAGWVTQTSVESVADALRQFLRAGGKDPQRGENARNLVDREYRWPAIAQKTIGIYEAILKDR